MTEETLSPGHFGGMILSAIARERKSGELLLDGAWSGELHFNQGRPSGCAVGGVPSRDVNAVRAQVRQAAHAMQGSARWRSAAPSAEPLPIDTMGEVLVALWHGLRDPMVETSLGALAQRKVTKTKWFERLLGAASKVAGVSCPAPTESGTVETWSQRANAPAKKLILILIALGGVTLSGDAEEALEQATDSSNVDEPTTAPKPEPARRSLRTSPLPADGPLRHFVVEIERLYVKLPQLNHYQVMGIDERATQETIKKAYLDLAKKWHADALRNQGVMPDVISMAEDVFVRMSEAHGVLTDQEERKSYDFVLDRQRRGLPTDPVVILEAEQIFQRGKNMVKRGKATPAEPVLRQAVEMNPGEAEFWIYWGYSLYSAFGTERKADAIDAIQKGLRINDKLADAHWFLGRIASGEGRFEEAEKHLKTCLQMVNNHRDAEFELRVVQRKLDRSGKGGGKAASGGWLGKLFKR